MRRWRWRRWRWRRNRAHTWVDAEGCVWSWNGWTWTYVLPNGIGLIHTVGRGLTPEVVGRGPFTEGGCMNRLQQSRTEPGGVTQVWVVDRG